MTLALVDYGAGNLQSVRNALRAAGAENIVVTADPRIVLEADRIVLPGVGAFGHCVNALRGIAGLEQALNDVVGAKARPFLGICVGMQIMVDEGEEFFATDDGPQEGVFLGLGWVEGTVRKIDAEARSVKVPHMGWNDVIPTASHPLIVPGEAYFLHSFAVDADSPKDVLATTTHGGTVCAAIGYENRIGVQFHPEKSQTYGLAFLSRFLAWKP